MKKSIPAIALGLAALLGAQAIAATQSASSLAGAFINAGGGPGSFSTVRAFDAMIGDTALQAELSTIKSRSTTQARDQFVRVFDFAMSDAWQRAGQDNVSVPDSTQSGLDLAKALYNAGMQGGAFSGEAFFNTLFTARVWTDVSHDIDAKFGAGTSATFAGNVGAMFTDLQSQVSSR
jgi:hypothetical protein